MSHTGDGEEEAFIRAALYSHAYYKALGKWRELARRAASLIRKRYPDARVYVYGSVVEGRYTAASDLDLLVLTQNATGRARDTAELTLWLEDELGVPPGLLHLVVIKPGSPDEERFFKAMRIKAVEVEPEDGDGDV